MPGRRCGFCGTSIDHLKATARFCSESCGRDDRRRREKASGADTQQMVWVRGHWRRKRRKGDRTRQKHTRAAVRNPRVPVAVFE